jgi:hypothetical protein
MSMPRPLGVAGTPLLKTFTQKRPPTPLKKVNIERAARLEERNFGPHGDWIRLQPCVVESRAHPTLRIPCVGRIVAAHLVPRGMGGCGGDRFSLFPACELHHDEQEGRTAEFQELYDLDLSMLVEAYCIADLINLTDDEREAARLRLAVLNEPR